MCPHVEGQLHQAHTAQQQAFNEQFAAAEQQSQQRESDSYLRSEHEKQQLLQSAHEKELDQKRFDSTMEQPNRFDTCNQKLKKPPCSPLRALRQSCRRRTPPS